jgi:hypothetical protein
MRSAPSARSAMSVDAAHATPERFSVRTESDRAHEEHSLRQASNVVSNAQGIPQAAVNRSSHVRWSERPPLIQTSWNLNRHLVERSHGSYGGGAQGAQAAPDVNAGASWSSTMVISSRGARLRRSIRDGARCAAGSPSQITSARPVRPGKPTWPDARSTVRR